MKALSFVLIGALMTSCSHYGSNKTNSLRNIASQELTGNETGNPASASALEILIEKHIKSCEKRGGVSSYYNSKEKISGLASEFGVPVSLPANWVGQMQYSSPAYFKNKETGEVVAWVDSMKKITQIYIGTDDLESAKAKQWVTSHYDTFIYDPKSNSYIDIGYIDDPQFGQLSPMTFDGIESCQLLRDQLLKYPEYKSSPGFASFEFTKFNINDNGIDYTTSKFCESNSDGSVPASIIDAFKDLKSSKKIDNLVNCVSLYHLYSSHFKMAKWFHMKTNVEKDELLNDYRLFIDKKRFKEVVGYIKTLRDDVEIYQTISALNSEVSVGITSSPSGSFDFSDNRGWSRKRIHFFTHPRDMNYSLYARYREKTISEGSNLKNEQIYVKVKLNPKSMTQRLGWDGVISVCSDSKFSQCFGWGGPRDFDSFKEDLVNNKIIRTSENETRFAIFKPQFIQGKNAEKNKYILYNNTEEGMQISKFPFQVFAPPLDVMKSNGVSSESFGLGLGIVPYAQIGYFSFFKENGKPIADLSGNICETISYDENELLFSCNVELMKKNK